MLKKQRRKQRVRKRSNLRWKSIFQLSMAGFISLMRRNFSCHRAVSLRAVPSLMLTVSSKRAMQEFHPTIHRRRWHPLSSGEGWLECANHPSRAPTHSSGLMSDELTSLVARVSMVLDRRVTRVQSSSQEDSIFLRETLVALNRSQFQSTLT